MQADDVVVGGKNIFLFLYIWGRVKIVQLGITRIVVMTCDSQKAISVFVVSRSETKLLDATTKS